VSAAGDFGDTRQGMPWPTAPTLKSTETPPAGGRVVVELQLLDGERIHGDIADTDDPAELQQVQLRWHGQPVGFPASAVRLLRRRPMLRRAEAPAAPPGASEVSEAGTLLSVHVEFIDGQTLVGETLGFVNRRAGGGYLFLRVDGQQFQAVWLPRPALRNIHLQRPEPAPLPAATVPWVPATRLPELLERLELAHSMPVLQMTQALFELGLIDAVTLHTLDQGTAVQLRSYIDARVGSGSWSDGSLEHARARAVRTPEVDAAVFEIDPQVLGSLPWSAAMRLRVVPLGLADGRLYIASDQPLNHDLAGQLGVLAGRPVSLVWSSKEQIDRRLSQAAPGRPAHDGDTEHAQSADAEIQQLINSAKSEIRAQGTFVQSYAVDEHSSIVQLVKRIISDAHAQKASDIHIETNPDEGLSRVRLRKDGELEEYLQVPPDLRAALVSRIKVMSKLDISERRRPQDGKINFADFSKIKLELRVAILPTHDGLEDVVLRLLASSRPIPLAQLGFSAQDEARVKHMAERPYGLILACGPTGSGKTTTLHSLLSEINTENRKIWTAEDPIEITQPGLRQLQVNPKIGLSFASAMRAFLRADPDVIMIGEIRDQETSGIAVEASLTGHLVLSTLHTNSAAESVVRLLDLGMDPMNFADSLIGIVAQRLVRALCKTCRERVPLMPDEFERLVADYAEGTPVTLEEARQRLLQAGGWASADDAGLHHGLGCPSCHGKGYKGRMGIYEVLQNSADLRQHIQARAMTRLIFDAAVSGGMRSLKQDALEKACAGMIDLKQARAVVG
jgi:type II secretory ATPase GspE/PulE/Tfp pilus assembly ATPase PilB-like protein